ncbi:SDR family oxidoreductase [Lacticaseibacillus sp. GG6-2]
MQQQTRILIIGGTSGFGAAVAIAAAKQAAHVHVVGQDPVKLHAFLEAHPGIAGSTLDATNGAALRNYFARHDAYTHLVSMLGGGMSGGFLNSDLAEIRAAVEAKFFANLQLAQIAASHVTTSLTFTSGSGGRPADASGAIVGNQALNTMVQGLAVELAPDKRVNAVAPTWTPTELWRDLSAEARTAQESAFAQGIPLKRVASVDEVASGYLYLMQNNFITGQILHIDGGVDL